MLRWPVARDSLPKNPRATPDGEALGFGRLTDMRDSTTVRVSRQTRDGLRELAEDDSLTLDAEIQRLVRAERQRRMGRELSEHGPDDADRQWLDLAADSVRSNDAGR